jgi:cytochrome c-type biogenesis protein
MGSTSIFFGGSVVAAAVAGSVSLFAPCCISIMLPAYFSSAFQNRRTLVSMTFLFAAGVATVILPIAVGAAFLERLFVSEHTLIYTSAGVLLLALAGYILAGGRLRLPMPGRRASGRTGPLSVYSLGIFSGITSSCCAPVLAGVLALSGVAGSFGAAAGLGSAYVFGMVAPLFVISLLWERFDLRMSRLFRPRSLTWRLGRMHRTISATTLASGILLALMGAATVYIGLFRDSMPSPRGWQASLSATLQHYGAKVTHALSFVPGWVAGVLLVLMILALGRRALQQLMADSSQDSGPGRGRANDGMELERGDEVEPGPDGLTPEPEHDYVS